jgi:hypothetical protein
LRQNQIQFSNGVDTELTTARPRQIATCLPGRVWHRYSAGEGATGTAPKPATTSGKPGNREDNPAPEGLRANSVDQQPAGKDQLLPRPAGQLAAAETY